MKDGKHVVLYADDDPDFIDSVRVVLEAAGYVMVAADNGEDGVKAYKQTEPDFIIVDLMMEEVDAGTSMVKELKAAGCTAPIYMLSSVGDAFSTSIDCTELGIDGVLQKPLDFDTLLNILATKLK